MADVIATVDNSMIKSDPDHLNLEFHDLAEKVVFKSKFRSVYNRILPPELLVNCPTKPVPKFLFYTRVIYKTLGLKHLVLILLFNLYAGFGGVLFYSIEGLLADENQSKVLADDTRNLSFKMSRLYNNSALDSTMKLNKSVSMILRYQMRSDQWPDLQKTNWDMTGSVFYAVTIFAGIGYGNYFAETVGGRVFTMVYACIGIPLMLVTLQDFGKLLGFALGTVWKNFSNLVKKLKRRGRKSRNLSVSSQQPFQWSEGSQSDLPLSVAFVLTIFWILLCGGIFRHWERDWTYIEAVYFMYISLTTIGLGDIMPVHISGMFAGFGLILVGLTLVSLLFDMIQQRISHYKRKLTDHIEKLLGCKRSKTKTPTESRKKIENLHPNPKGSEDKSVTIADMIMASIIAKFRLEANSGTACIHGTFATLKRTFLLLLLILYALIGGAILSSLEFPNEKAMKEQRLELLRSEALNLSGQIFQIFNSNGNSWRESSNITTALLKRYQMSKHIIITDTTISDFQSSLFYSLTLITTIGYGNLFTKTVWGRVTTIIYSAIGIPITLATLSDLGKFLSRLLKRLWHKTVACCAKLKRRAATTDDDNESLKSAYLDSFDFPISVAVIILFVWSIGCAEVFRWWETDWSHFYSIYFYFISVTTIGLGDITPSQPHLYLLNFGLIMVGMTFISMLFSLVSEKLSYWSDKTSSILEETVKKKRSRVGVSRV